MKPVTRNSRGQKVMVQKHMNIHLATSLGHVDVCKSQQRQLISEAKNRHNKYLESSTCTKTELRDAITQQLQTSKNRTKRT